MADFTAGHLERLAASAYDLVANAFLGEPSAMGLQGQKLEPVCTEPFCGGFYWQEIDNSLPEQAPPLGSPKGVATHPAADPDAAPPTPESPEKQVSNMLADKPLDKIDLTSGQFFPPLDKPIANRIKLLPASNNDWPWYLANDAKYVTLGMGRNGEISVAVGKRHRNELLDHLDSFMKLDADVMLEGTRILKGSQLLVVKPGKQPLRVAPWVGGKQQLETDDFPLHLGFGMPKKPSSMPERPDWPLAPNNEERPTLPVKRLDVVLRKPRRGLEDFLPPLLTSKEPKMEAVEERL